MKHVWIVEVNDLACRPGDWGTMSVQYRLAWFVLAAFETKKLAREFIKDIKKEQTYYKAKYRIVKMVREDR